MNHPIFTKPLVGVLGLMAVGLLLAGGLSAKAQQFPVPTNAPAGFPSWWFARGVIVPTNTTNTVPVWPSDYPTSDDYAVINQGTLKNLATCAFAELQNQLPSTVLAQSNATALQSLIASWGDSTNADNYAVVNQGQLKALTGAFYDVLGTGSYTAGIVLQPANWINGTYPWNVSTNTNAVDAYLVANIGQAKNLFSFDLSAPPGQVPNWWLQFYLGTTNISPASPAPSGNGLTILQAYQLGADPTYYYSQGNSNQIVPVITLVSGDAQNEAPGSFASNPIVVNVSDQYGNLLTNAPVTFSLQKGGLGFLAAGTNTLATNTTLAVKTDTNGNAQIYFQEDPSDVIQGDQSVITCSSGGAAPVQISSYCNILIGQWNFEEGDGTTTSDTSLWSNTGTLYNGVTWNTSFDGSGGLLFDGLSGYVQISNTPSFDLGTNSLTVSAFIQLGTNASLTSITNIYEVIHKGIASGNGFSLAIQGGSVKGLMATLFNGGSPQQVVPLVDQSARLSDGNWHQIGFTRDTNGVGILYIDGSAVGTNSSMTASISSSQPLCFGCGENRNFFNGSMDQMLVECVSAQSNDMAGLITQIPTAPTNLTLTYNTNSGAATLAWGETANFLTSFSIQQSSDGGNTWSILGNVASTNYSCLLPGLMLNTNYLFIATANTINASSSASAPIQLLLTTNSSGVTNATIANSTLVVTNQVASSNSYTNNIPSLNSWFDDIWSSATLDAWYDWNPITPFYYIRGSTNSNNHSEHFQSEVVSIDQVQGSPLSTMGTNVTYPSNALPWFKKISNSLFYQLDSIDWYTQTPTWLSYTSPIVAFGAAGGGDPLYIDQPYRFGLGIGRNYYNISGSLQIAVYSPGNTNPVYTTNIVLPCPGGADWNNFVTNGYSRNYGLTNRGAIYPMVTTLQYVSGDYTCLLTHKAWSTNYTYAINYMGTDVGGNNMHVPSTVSYPVPNVPIYGKNGQPTGGSNYSATYAYGYTLDFTNGPSNSSTALLMPQFSGIPMPPEYSGMSLQDLVNIGRTNNSITYQFTSYSQAYQTLDNSPELRTNAILDKFVSDMGSNPIVLANYVLNQIHLTDAYLGQMQSMTNLCAGSINRSALATFLEKEGSPTEQCALLIYFLRKCGVNCGYVFAPQNSMMMLNSQVNSLLHAKVTSPNLSNALAPAQLLPVNYPWVAAYVTNGTNGVQWVHLFPWLKDTAVKEGYDLNNYLPVGYNTGMGWLEHYLQLDPTIMGLATVDDPGVLYTRYINKQLSQSGLTTNDVGIRYVDRPHNYTTWAAFPQPFSISTNNIGNQSLVGSLGGNPNNFNTIRCKLNTGSNSLDVLDTGLMRTVDLHDRLFLIHTIQPPIVLWNASKKKYATNYATTNLSIAFDMEPLRPGTSGSNNFINDSNLIAAQSINANAPYNKNVLNIQLTYTIPSSGFSKTINRPYFLGEAAALCLDYGQITQPMIDAQAQKYWTAQQATLVNTNIQMDTNTSLGTPLLIEGLSYWKHVDEFEKSLDNLQKWSPMSRFNWGFSKVSPPLNTNAALQPDAKIRLVFPNVDMLSEYGINFVGNGSANPSNGLSIQNYFQNTVAIAIAQSSMQESETLDFFYNTKDSASTIALLHRAEKNKRSILQLNSGNYLQLGASMQPIYWPDIVTTTTVQGWLVTNNIENNTMYYEAPKGNLYNINGNQYKYLNIKGGSLKGNTVNPDDPNYVLTSQYGTGNTYTYQFATVTVASSTNTYSYPSNIIKRYPLSTWCKPDIWPVIDKSLGWQAIYNVYNDPYHYTNAVDARVFITPGPVSMARGYYIGMGALIFDPQGTGVSALISAASLKGTINGGVGALFDSLGSILAPSMDNYNVSLASLDSSADGPTFTFDSSSYNVGLSSQMFYANANSGNITYNTKNIENIDFKSTTLSPQQVNRLTAYYNYTSDSYALYYNLYNLPNTGTKMAQVAAAAASTGDTGETSYFKNWMGAVSQAVADPVNVIQGNFYINDTDLTIEGPMPILCSRNYDSFNLANNEFGEGWKMGYFAYLVQPTNSTKNPLLFAAEMDGSVLSYRRQTNGDTNTWVPMPADNPTMANQQGDHSGSTYNLFNNKIVLSLATNLSTNVGWGIINYGSPPQFGWTNIVSQNVTTNYTLFGSDGSVRRFSVASYPFPSKPETKYPITRTRPYLQTWTDPQGNSLNFSFGSDTNSPGYGFLNRITANNGNFLQLNYDINGHITSANAADGRIVTYEYDSSGDLISVTRPDASVVSYSYQHSKVESLHLITQENKPGGRVLQNAYDNSRRVTNQSSSVGSNGSLVTTATFRYTVSSSTPNGTAKTGSTKLIYPVNGINYTNVYTYSGSQLTQVKNPLGDTVVTSWYPTNAVKGLSGAYPSSLQARTDKNGLTTSYYYDQYGNITNMTSAGAITAVGASDSVVTSISYQAPALPATNPLSGVNLLPSSKSENGVTTTFTYDTTYPYLPKSVIKKAGSTILSETDTTYTTSASQALGVVSSVTQSSSAPGDSSTVTYGYSGSQNGFPTSETHSSASGTDISYNLTYNLRNQLERKVDNAGRATSYAYDDLGNQIWEELFDTTGKAVAWQFNYYNANGEIEWTQGSRYNPTDYTQTVYDQGGRISQKLVWRSGASGGGVGGTGVAVTTYTHDSFGNLTQVTDANGNTTTMGYDAIGQMTSRTSPTGTEHFGYNAGGQITGFTNALGGVATASYNAFGQPFSITSPDSSTHSWAYYPDGQIKTETLPSGAVRSLGDAGTSLTVAASTTSSSGTITESKGYDSRGNLVGFTDGDGNAFSTSYDSLNRPILETGPAPGLGSAQQSNSITYGAAGTTKTVTDALGNQTVTTFDVEGRPLSVANAAQVTAYAYSPDHQSVTMTSGSGAIAVVTTTFTDFAGKPLMVKKADGGTITYSYDALENLLSTTDELGRTTGYSYNSLNLPLTQTLADGATITFGYDALGDLTSRAMPGGLTWSATYTPAGQILTEQLTQNGTNTRNFTYTYNTSGTGDGQLATITDPRNIVSANSYDGFGRLTSTTQSDPSYGVSLSYGYNNRGFPTSITQSYQNTNLSPNTTVTRSYDPYGAIASEVTTLGGTTVASWTQGHDGAGNRTALNNQISGSPSYGFGYDAAGNCTNTLLNSVSYKSAFNQAGLVTTRGSQSLVLDNVGRVTNALQGIGSTTYLTENLHWLSNSTQSSDVLTRGTATDSRAYSYDSRNHLTRQNYGTSGIAGYHFDNDTPAGLGLRTGITLTNATGTNAANYGNFARLALMTNNGVLTNSGVGTPVTQTYDAAGNVLTRVSGSITDSNTWDGLGQLVKTTRSGGGGFTSWGAVYDGLGRRIRTTLTPTSGTALTIQSLFDPDIEFLELGVKVASGSTTNNFWKVYGPDLSGAYGGLQGTGGLLAVYNQTAGNTSTIFNDTYGHLQGWSNSSTGYHTNAVSFDGYGALPGSGSPGVISATTTDLATVIGWRGKYLDPTGLYNLGARYYAPDNGEFLSPDPLGHSASMDLYSYCNGDPVNGFDADGRISSNFANNKGDDPNSEENLAYADRVLASDASFSPAQVRGINNFFIHTAASLVKLPTALYQNSKAQLSFEATLLKNPSKAYAQVEQARKNFPQALLNTLYGLRTASETPEGRAEMVTGAAFSAIPAMDGLSTVKTLGGASGVVDGLATAKTAGQLGKEGESAVRALYDIGKKPSQSIFINGRARIPDGINELKNTLSEVKNVGRLSFTRQLRDYLEYSQSRGLRFDLYTRPGVKLSGPLQDAIDSGLINQIPIRGL